MAATQTMSFGVKDLVDGLGERTAGVYKAAKAASPSTLQRSLERVEEIAEPYAQPVTARLSENLETLDIVVAKRLESLNETVVKPCQERVVAPTNRLYKHSVEYASEKYGEADRYLREKRTTISHTVNETVIKPCQDNVLAPTEEYIGKVADNVLTRADDIVDTFLPSEAEVEAEAEAEAKAGAEAGATDKKKEQPKKEKAQTVAGDEGDVKQRAFHLTTKIASRTQKKAAAATLAVTLLGFGVAKRVGFGGVAQTMIDTAAVNLPNQATTGKIGAVAVTYTPTLLKPSMERGVTILTPALNLVFDAFAWWVGSTHKAIAAEQGEASASQASAQGTKKAAKKGKNKTAKVTKKTA